MKPPFQNFVACVLLRYLLPLMPLVIAYIYDKDVLLRALTLSTSIYIITQGLATKHIVTLAVSLITGFLLIGVYGAIDKTASALPLETAPPIYALSLILAMHFVERYIRHVKDYEPFFAFSTKNEPEPPVHPVSQQAEKH